MNILVTVKTYPTPSRRYKEIVCTAGVLEDGRWIRLYPIDYRYNNYSQWYKKYQWIEVEVKKHNRDPRSESYRPIGNIRLGKVIGTKDNWAERKRYILAKGIRTMCYLQQQSQKDISLGVVKPSQVIDFYWKPTKNRDWTPKQRDVLNQLSLLEKNRPLEKIPYKFSYYFKCEENSCKGHKMMIEDWEVMALYRKMRDEFGEERALEKVKEKFLNQICSPQKDTHFFVGTVLQWGKWIIIGTFWPQKVK
ncbi:MAG: hypothetical protein HY769_04080 [Candidatus Stahlbacteria bacterium]|nr:hypothetical protein [Candidatus Stahlbacteria bacterium]